MALIILVPCFLFLILGIVLGVLVTASSKRNSEPSCPACGHVVRGLVEPICPECGRSLDAGVVKAGWMPPRTRRTLGLLILIAGALVTLTSVPVSYASWNALLDGLGLMQVSTRFELGAAPRSRSGGVASDKADPGDGAPYIFDFTIAGELLDMESEEGAVRLDIQRDQETVASWSGVGEALPEPHGVRISGLDAVKSLREQIPAETGTPLATWLDDEEDSVVLAEMIQSIAADPASRQAQASVVIWKTRDGTQIFDGAGAFGGNSDTALEASSALLALWVFMPSGLAALTIIWAVFLLDGRRALQPFEDIGEAPASD